MARKKKNDGGIWWMPYMWIIVFAGCIWYGLAHDGLWQGVKLCGVAFGIGMILFYAYYILFTSRGRRDIAADLERRERRKREKHAERVARNPSPIKNEIKRGFFIGIGFAAASKIFGNK